MSRERRLSNRQPADIRVQIRYRRRRFLGARGRDLSVQGMYLEVRNLTLPAGTRIELEFEALGRPWLIPAVVVHCNGSGIGVMFQEPQPGLYQGKPEPGISRRRLRPGSDPVPGLLGGL